MSENIITAEIRERVGKGAAREARRNGFIPGVIYGDKKSPQSITVARKQMDKLLQQPGLFNSLYELQVGDQKEQVLPRDVQLDVVTDVPLHVDFLRLSGATEITIDVPVVFINQEESEGLKQGGVLNVVRHQIEVRCKASAIPQFIEVDLTGAEMGDSLHISAVSLPEGVAPTITDRDFTIVTVAAPTVHVEPEDEVGIEGEEGEEGEILGGGEIEEGEAEKSEEESGEE